MSKKKHKNKKHEKKGETKYLTMDDVISEKLTKKKRRTETILERTSPSFESIMLKSELKSFQDNVHVVKDNALCLSMA